MNLLDRIKSAAIIILAILFVGCEQETGGLVLDTDNAVTVKLQEFNLSSRNIYIDSLRTDHETAGVTGIRQHPQLGKITGIANLDYRFNVGIQVTDTVNFDSLIFSLNIADYTTLPADSILRFAVHASAERIYGDAVYLSNRSIELGNRPDTIRVKVGRKGRPVKASLNRLGQTIYNQLLQETTDSYRFFRRTLIVSPLFEDENLLFSFNIVNDSSFMVLYSSSDTVSYQTRFNFTSANYNTVFRDKSTSEIAGINNLDTFSLENNATYVSPLAGVMTQIDLEPFVDFIKESKDIIINKAEITLNTHPNNQLNVFAFRYYFYKPGYGISGEGLFRDPIRTVILSNQGYITNDNSLLIGRLDNTSYYYNDLTLFAEIFFSLYRDQSEILTEKLVLVSNNNLTVNETILQQNDIKLRVYYTTLK